LEENLEVIVEGCPELEKHLSRVQSWEAIFSLEQVHECLRLTHLSLRAPDFIKDFIGTAKVQLCVKLNFFPLSSSSSNDCLEIK
jgi:hypothetical protein